MTIFILISIVVGLKIVFIIKRAFHMLKWIFLRVLIACFYLIFSLYALCLLRFWFYCKKREHIYFMFALIWPLFAIFINEPFNLWVSLIKYSKKNTHQVETVIILLSKRFIKFILKVKSAWNDRFNSFIFNKK
jgi:hypothetical protein